MNMMLPRPMRTTTGSVSGNHGVAARARRARPKPTEARTRSRTATSRRRAVISAPTTEPMLIADISTVYQTTGRPKVLSTSTGMNTLKLNASVPMMVIITSGTHSSCSLRA